MYKNVEHITCLYLGVPYFPFLIINHQARMDTILVDTLNF